MCFLLSRVKVTLMTFYGILKTIIGFFIQTTWIHLFLVIILTGTLRLIPCEIVVPSGVVVITDLVLSNEGQLI